MIVGSESSIICEADTANKGKNYIIQDGDIVTFLFKVHFFNYEQHSK